MTVTTTADPATGSATLLAAAIGGVNDQRRFVLLAAAMLTLAVVGFVTAGLASAPVHEPATYVCSEACAPSSTTTGPRPAGRPHREATSVGGKP